MNIIHKMLENYYDESNGSWVWRALDYIDCKYNYSNTRLSQAPSDIDFIRYWFYNIVGYIYVSVVLLSPQLVAWPCYFIAQIRYKHRFLDTSYTMETIIPEMKKWCEENNIKAFWFFDWINNDVIFFPREMKLSSDMVGFINEEDLIAFKLRWL